MQEIYLPNVVQVAVEAVLQEELHKASYNMRSGNSIQTSSLFLLINFIKMILPPKSVRMTAIQVSTNISGWLMALQETLPSPWKAVIISARRKSDCMKTLQPLIPQKGLET